ncbi:MAG: CDP-alcohol phosphatidyltransferase family protein [Candidatus Hodarchaeales archaeon]
MEESLDIQIIHYDEFTSLDEEFVSNRKVKCVVLVPSCEDMNKSEKNVQPLTDLFGIPCIERIIYSAKKAGIDEFFTVIEEEDTDFQNLMTKLSDRFDIKIETISFNGTENSLYELLSSVQNDEMDDFLLIKANYYVDYQIFEKMINKTSQTDSVLIAIDRNINDFNLDYQKTASKVLLDKNNRIKEFGSDLSVYNALVPDIVVFSAEFLAQNEVIIDRNFSLDNTITEITRIFNLNSIQTVDISRNRWIEVKNNSCRKKARKFILKNLVKPVDGLISRYIIRKCSTKITTPLLLKIHSKITPNQVSLLSLVIAMISGLFFFTGNAVMGALLILLSNTIDHSDGEIARLKHMQSPSGDFIDAVFDRTSDTIVYLGILSYLFSRIADTEIFGIYWSTITIIIICVAALAGNLMVSYTSSKAVINLDYRFDGILFGTGRGRDTRVFLVFIGGLLTIIHPVSVLFSMMALALLTCAIVVWRTFVVWNKFNPNRGLADS